MNLLLFLVGAMGILFQGVSERSKNEFSSDQCRFIYERQYHNRNKGILKRYYKIKNLKRKL